MSQTERARVGPTASALGVRHPPWSGLKGLSKVESYQVFLLLGAEDELNGFRLEKVEQVQKYCSKAIQVELVRVSRFQDFRLQKVIKAVKRFTTHHFKSRGK